MIISNRFFSSFQTDSLKLIKQYNRNQNMTASFRCYVTNQRLSILDYEENKTNGRYRAVINEDKVAVLHLQSVNINPEDTPVSELSLCPGVLESNVIQLLSSLSTANYLVQLYIEKVDQEIVYRSRSCQLVITKSKGEVCEACKVLLNTLILHQSKMEPIHSPAVKLKQVLEEGEECKTEEKFADHYGSDDNMDSLPAESNNVSEDEEDFDVEDPEYRPEDSEDKVQGKPTVIKIMKRAMTGGENDQKEDAEHHCDQCDYKAPNRRGLRRHIINRHLPPRFNCPHCSFKATRTEHLKHHIQSKHEQIYLYCDQCDFKCWTVINLKAHVSSQHGSPVSFPCNQCSMTFKSRKGRNSHIDSIHKLIKYTCEQCGKQFFQKTKLSMHMKTEHQGIKYPCSQCDYK